MTKLVKSTSGVRGIVFDGLHPAMATRYGAAFGTLLKSGRVVVGRDSRPSGEVLMPSVIAGLRSVGIEVIEIGIVPTPTVEIAVQKLRAAGGICITASHNPAQWNALKFFNNRGEFITPTQYRKLDNIFEKQKFAYKPHAGMGEISTQDNWVEEHVRQTLALKVVKRAAVKRRRFKVVVDAVNGAGSLALPLLLRKLGVSVVELNCRGDGDFVREPEPVAGNITGLARAVKKHRADLGMACDPDADRLALVDEKGRPAGEELTLALAAAAVLSSRRGPTVINLSTSKVTVDTARSCGSKVYYSKVGEANVVQMMRRKKAVIGGEGNGGVIYPAFHAGRDALVAAALVLSHLAGEKTTLSKLVSTFPAYYTVKTKGRLRGNFTSRLKSFEKEIRRLVGKTRVDRRDGLRFDFDQGWVQIRASNTEPIYRVIVETRSRTFSQRLSVKVTKFFS
ncbi:MAG: phosphoglucosamine mutase [Candidatus Zixiibacteriota bacterium]|nr:MAG: phosphoglucosamine mutase [candidate division Zixibacteria bacterium]